MRGLHTNNSEERTRWLRLLLTVLAMVVMSIGLAALTQNVIANAMLPLGRFDWLAYLIVFGMMILANFSIIVPVPFGVSIMIAAATRWDPMIVVLAGALGGTFGELSGYYAGYLGKKIAIPEGVPWLKRMERWISHYGFWAIFLLSFQPVFPFDVGGLIAGTAKMPMRKFLPALFLGKVPKYALFVFGGRELMHLLPFFSP
ncbi:MAG: VTT domain-containing protein [Chloroflexi bacterium]|nr:VTT domain-containing protein [Chloroflexota bacterium]